MNVESSNRLATAVLTAALLALADASSAQKSAPAIEKFQILQADLRKSHSAKDWRSTLVSARAIRSLLNDAPQSLLEVARAEVGVGDLHAAVREVETFARMGQSADLLRASSDFSPLLKYAPFERVRSAMENNRRAISRASTAFLLSDSGLLLEDVDYHPRTKQFFVSSVREKKILSVSASGTITDFAKAPDNWPMLALKVDVTRNVLWATEVAMQGFASVVPSDWGRSAVLCYDLKSGQLLRRVEGLRGTTLGDMVLTPGGDVIVSDGEGGGVYRLPADGSTMQRLDNGDFISPQTPAMLPDGMHLLVPDYLRGIGVLDMVTKQVEWLSTGGRFALDGIDGLYFSRGTLIAVQNGTSPTRVVTLTLNSALTKIESQTVIERATPTLGVPTHGVVIGPHFYYIANSGWDVIDDHGNVKSGKTSSVPRIMRTRWR